MLSDRDRQALASEFLAAQENGQRIAVAPSARERGFDLASAYAVEQEVVALRAAKGHKPVGYKVGFANRTVWRALNLETVAWAHMYDDTVHLAPSNHESLSITRMRTPKIEPEIVFKLGRDLDGTATEPADVLDAVEWIALGVEIVDNPFVEATFQPADFVAALGFHAAAIVGAPLTIEKSRVPHLLEQLATFTASLTVDGRLAAEGPATNVLGSPALCLTELASAMARRAGGTTLAAGDLVFSGSAVEAQPLAPGQTWVAAVKGIELPALTIRTVS